jgi:hypothetical protein
MPGIGRVEPGRSWPRSASPSPVACAASGSTRRPRSSPGSTGREHADQMPQANARAPRLVVLAGPTAVGKGTVSAYIRTHFPAGVALGVDDHPRRRARGRSTGCTTTSSRPRSSTGSSQRGSSWSMPSCTAAPSTAPRVVRSSEPSPLGQPAAAGDRPAGSPSGARDDARGAVRLSRPAELGRTRAPVGRARHRDAEEREVRLETATSANWRPPTSSMSSSQRRCRAVASEELVSLMGWRPRRS